MQRIELRYKHQSEPFTTLVVQPYHILIDFPVWVAERLKIQNKLLKQDNSWGNNHLIRTHWLSHFSKDKGLEATSRSISNFNNQLEAYTEWTRRCWQSHGQNNQLTTDPTALIESTEFKKQCKRLLAEYQRVHAERRQAEIFKLSRDLYGAARDIKKMDEDDIREFIDLSIVSREYQTYLTVCEGKAEHLKVMNLYIEPVPGYAIDATNIVIAPYLYYQWKTVLVAIGMAMSKCPAPRGFTLQPFSQPSSQYSESGQQRFWN